MQVILYKNNSDNNVLRKTLTQVQTLSCQLLDDTARTAPVLTLAAVVTADYNYCYIADMGRYYYITDKTVVNGNRVRVLCKVDVLMSFKTQILAAYGIVEATGSMINNYIDSSIWTPDCRRTTNVKNFSAGFNQSPQYILMTAGGYQSGTSS